jgi:cobalt-zinc-cadmium resistance protein CzcA
VALGEVRIETPAGGHVPLAHLATMEETSGPTTIHREHGKRRIVVQANVRGRDLGSFVAEARGKLAAVSLPAGMYTRWSGQFEHLQRARERLLLVVPLTLLLIAALLWITYRRLVDCARVFTGVPFALVGGVLALALRGLPFSISAAVGFIALSGIAVLDDMVLVSRMRQLRARGVPAERAIREAALTRLRPVIMTSLVAALGFLPMALSTGMGAEVQRPLATVVIGGVLSATVLTLLVLPALSLIIERKVEASGVPVPATAGGEA